MSMRSSIDMAAVLQHRDRLPELKAVMRQDIEAARERVRTSLENAASLVDEARDRLDDLCQEDDEDVSETHEQDIDNAENYVRACLEHMEEVGEYASRMQLLVNQLERDFEEKYAAARNDLYAKLEQYGAFAAISVDDVAGSRRERTALPASTTGATSPLTSQGAASLPQLPIGFCWIPLDSLAWSEVTSLTFQKARRDDIEAMMNRFASVILPMLQDPAGVNRDQLVRLDAILGSSADQSRTLAFAWDCLLSGSDPIALTAPDPQAGPFYGWTSGRHRAVVAKSMGWTHVPARVV